MKKFCSNSLVAAAILFLYIPLFIIVIFSFNNNGSVNNFIGYTFGFKYYAAMFANHEFMLALFTTIIIALFATIIAVFIGTLAAISLSKSSRLLRKSLLSINKLPIINADVVTAVGLTVLFVGLALPFGFWTMLFAHVAFCVPYVVLTVRVQLRNIDQNMIEASVDLGANEYYTIRKIIIPNVKFGILSGAALCFAYSFDDFIISYFTGGDTQNISIFLYNTRHYEPYVNAFTTIFMILIGTGVIGYNYWQHRRQRLEHLKTKLPLLSQQINQFYLGATTSVFYQNRKYWQIIHKYNHVAAQVNQLVIKQQQQTKRQYQLNYQRLTAKRWYQKIIWKNYFLSLLMVGGVAGISVGYMIASHYDLIIATFYPYINQKLVDDFSARFHKKVRFVSFTTNEDFYNKMQTCHFDAAIISDYMADRMAVEGRIQMLDWPRLKDLWGQIQGAPVLARADQLNPEILNKIAAQFPIQTKQQNNLNLTDFTSPYYFGTVNLYYNLDRWSSYQQDLVKANTSPDLWSSMWTSALQLNKTVALYDDTRYMFMYALFDVRKEHPTECAGGINPDTLKCLDYAYAKLQTLIPSSNALLINPDDTGDFAALGNFDVMVANDGDMFYAVQKNPNLHVKKFNIGSIAPNSPDKIGSNVYEDGFVMLKSDNPTQTDLAYKFIALAESNDESAAMQPQVGYASTNNFAYNGLLATLSQTAPVPGASSVYDLFKVHIGPNDAFFNDYLADEIADYYNRVIALKH